MDFVEKDESNCGMNFPSFFVFSGDACKLCIGLLFEFSYLMFVI
jgi:hypothetical protein